MSDTAEYSLDRVFDAPRAMVWRAWTDPDLLARWYGPGVETVIHRFDLTPGGMWLNEMKWGEKSNRSKMVFREIVPEEKLVWMQSSTDADWNDAADPMMENWPTMFLTTIIFSDKGAQTNVRLSMVPVGATEAENASFAAAMANMDGGWGKGYAIIDDILAELQAKG